MSLAGKKIAIIATDLFENAELVEPKAALEEAGAETVVIAPHEGSIQGVNHHEDADEVAVDEVLDEADPADYDAVLLPGGAMNADELRTNIQAQNFVKAIDAAGKPLAVICHGPWLLIEADLVDGKKMTSWPSITTDLSNAGAEWVEEEVVVDGAWVSSRKPDDIPAFNKAFIDLLSETD
jgi:protease I